MYIEVNMTKVVIKVLQGSADFTKTALGGLTIISPSCKFPIGYMCQNCESRLAVYKQVIVTIKLKAFFLAHPVYTAEEVL